jgi:general stress protein 26
MDVKGKIKEVIKNHNVVHLATVDPSGKPSVRGVDYAGSEKENVLYFMTHKMSKKVAQIKNNPNIAVAIDHDCKSMEELQRIVFLKGTGTATIVQDQVEAQKAGGLMMTKFPFLKELPYNPADMVVIKIELKEILLTDHTVSFGNTETVTY